MYDYRKRLESGVWVPPKPRGRNRGPAIFFVLLLGFLLSWPVAMASSWFGIAHQWSPDAWIFVLYGWWFLDIATAIAVHPLLVGEADAESRADWS